jgi:hypothetical protein
MLPYMMDGLSIQKLLPWLFAHGRHLSFILRILESLIFIDLNKPYTN